MRRRFRLDPDKAWALGGVAAAFAVAALANVWAARSFRRWDWTESKRYTLNPPTLETLHALAEPVDVWVLLGGGDPMEQSVKQILVGYQAETAQLRIHYVDPDRDAPALDEVRRRFRVETGRSEDGRVVTDAVLVVARGDRHWFVAESDLVEIDEKDPKAKPREEQAITGAIRHVASGGARTVLCFTTGHGERALADGSDDGLGLLKDVLEKDNYETRAVDTADPGAREPFKGCAVVVIAPPSVRTGTMAALSAAELDRLGAWLAAGGNLLVGMGPETDAPAPGLSKALAPFGIELDAAWALEADPRFVFPDTRLNTFAATVKPHPVTGSLAIDPDVPRPPPRVVLEMARPLSRTASDAAVDDLLVTSPQSFAVGFHRAKDIVTGAGDPVREPGDTPGPLVVAMASERPKTDPAAPHGPRAVVVGSAAAFAAAHWRQSAPWRGTAVLVENAIAWLAAKPRVLDIPARPSVAAGLRVTDESRAEVRRYVLVYMPLTVAVLGVAMALARRSSEDKSGKARGKERDEEDDAP